MRNDSSLENHLIAAIEGARRLMPYPVHKDTFRAWRELLVHGRRAARKARAHRRRRILWLVTELRIQLLARKRFWRSLVGPQFRRVQTIG